MQSQSSFFRASILIATGAITTLALGFLVFTHYKSTENQAQTETKLHRRNAVRRRRRRWRQGFQPADLDYDPLLQALRHLEEREESGNGYGLYTNQHYVTAYLLASHRDELNLLPSKLERIHALILTISDLSPEAAHQLKLHIHFAFVGNFLAEEYPHGYLVGRDVDRIVEALQLSVSPYIIRKCVEAFDQTGYIVEMDHQCTGLSNIAEQQYNALEDGTTGEPSQSMSPTELHNRLTEGVTLADQDGEQLQGQNVLDLLYRIGEEQAKRSGYQHRGIECDGCGMQPIRGIRYHCANCWEYDLCEACESQQTHHKTHVFYKIRIPAPTRGQIKLVQPIWYPGNPNECPDSIPFDLKEVLLKDTDLDRQDLDALYDQFKCIAGYSLKKDQHRVGMAIDKPAFHRYFSTTTADRPSKPNLIHDRIFVFYDQDGDGLISFYEFAKGMSELMHNTSRHARVERAFQAFDLDSDGYLERKDFIRMLRAHYALNKELAEEVMLAREDTILGNEEMHEVIRGSNPISAAFRGSMFDGHQSRHGEGKSLDELGDIVMKDVYEGILRDDSELLGNRAEAIARQASGGRSLLQRSNPNRVRTRPDEPIIPLSHVYAMSDDHSELEVNEDAGGNTEDVDNLHQPDRWPNESTDESDVRQALGTNIPLDDILDPVDRQRILFAQNERQYQEKEEVFNNKERLALWKRWERRRFYMDEQEGFANPDSDSEDSELHGIPESPGQTANPNTTFEARRSRSSSKVRFDESAVDDHDEQEAEAFSRVSSKSNTPVNERWGGIDFAETDRDIGREYIYEAVQEAFLEMLDYFFKDVEEKTMEAIATRKSRERYADELQKYEDSLKLKDGTAADITAYQNRIHAEAIRVGNEFIRKFMQDREISLGRLDTPVSIPGDIAPGDDEIHQPPDPTLPQNRPNEELDLRQDEEVEKVIFEVYDEKYSINPRILPWWHEHNVIDEQARERRGYGKLSLEEFKQKLRADVDANKNTLADGEMEFWETRADLGNRFSFLSTWLEMASF